MGKFVSVFRIGVMTEGKKLYARRIPNASYSESLRERREIMKCIVCQKEAEAYWKKADGTKADLCFEHFEEMEREVHSKEKELRKVSSIFNIVVGKEPVKNKCPNGEYCKYCKELNL